jgi:hypothetical protein
MKEFLSNMPSMAAIRAQMAHSRQLWALILLFWAKVDYGATISHFLGGAFSAQVEYSCGIRGSIRNKNLKFPFSGDPSRGTVE